MSTPSCWRRGVGCAAGDQTGGQSPCHRAVEGCGAPVRWLAVIQVMAVEGFPGAGRCWMLEVSESSDDAWRNWPPSTRALGHVWPTEHHPASPPASRQPKGSRGSAPPPTTRPWKRLASGTSRCSGTTRRAGRGWHWSGPGGFGGCATGGSVSRPHQPPQTRLGLRRTCLRRLGSARTWVGLGIFAYDLQRMTVVAG
jgi:hypothetical protein